jgi:uncharacterized protein involved in tolerance to divalent cations
MTKTERNVLVTAIAEAKEMILDLTDGSPATRRQAKLDSSLVTDRLAACLNILRNMSN